MLTQIYFTRNYNHHLRRIEDFIFESTEELKQVEAFLDEHDSALKFIADNPNAAGTHPETGEQS